MTAPARISQADVERIAKGARRGGARSAKIELDPKGNMVILIDFGEGAESVTGENEWDEVLER